MTNSPMTALNKQALKPGLYAILFRNNWDGEGDTYEMLASLDENLIWHNYETGKDLFEYEGDEILKSWLLNDSTTVDALEAAERRIAEQGAIVAAAEKLVRCKGRYHSEINYRSLAKLFGVTTPDLPPLEHENVHYADAAEMEIAALRQRINEQESRTVTLPVRASMLYRTDFHKDYRSVMAYKASEVVDAIRAAGIGVKGE